MVLVIVQARHWSVCMMTLASLKRKITLVCVMVPMRLERVQVARGKEKSNVMPPAALAVEAHTLKQAPKHAPTVRVGETQHRIAMGLFVMAMRVSQVARETIQTVGAMIRAIVEIAVQGLRAIAVVAVKQIPRVIVEIL